MQFRLLRLPYSFLFSITFKRGSSGKFFSEYRSKGMLACFNTQSAGLSLQLTATGNAEQTYGKEMFNYTLLMSNKVSVLMMVKTR